MLTKGQVLQVQESVMTYTPMGSLSAAEWEGFKAALDLVLYPDRECTFGDERPVEVIEAGHVRCDSSRAAFKALEAAWLTQR